MDESNLENKELPSISIIDITESSEGETNISFEVSDDFIEMVKKELNTDDVSQTDLSEYVNKLLTNCASKKDGFDYIKS